MTAGELEEIIEAGRERLAEVYRANEYLAFNTAALTLTAINAPHRFPADPDKAFPGKKHSWQEAKAEMTRIAERNKNDS